MALLLKVKKFVSQHVSGTAAYHLLRAVYQSAFNREWVRRRVARRTFYREFVRRGSLVFDVGANTGEYSYAFLQLGARVVAIEPNPECCERLRGLGRRKRLTIRCEAIGGRQGEASLFVGEHTGHSTVSKEWMETASKNDPEFRWNTVVKCTVNTLDSLRREHGAPDFIKIDVEGFELSVLRGMSFRPSALSFEFHAFSPEQVRECLLLPVFDFQCTFNISLGDEWQFVWPDWRDKQAVLDYASTLTGNTFGDVYVKFS